MADDLNILTAQDVLAREREVLDLTASGAQGSALCLSGGGIRSAAFCLGVIQALAARKLLSKFDYLSTVSGGGYIGAWLTRCIVAFEGDVEKTETALNDFKVPETGKAKGDADDELLPSRTIEPRQINRLRRYTNYLTPSPGLFSADTWAGFVLIGRNTLINWAVFVPLFLAAAAMPVVYTVVVAGCGHLWHTPLGVLVFGGIGGVAAFWHYRAVYNTCLGLPSHLRSAEAGAPTKKNKIGLRTAAINRDIIRPGLLWIFLVPVAAAVVCQPNIPLKDGVPQLRSVFFSADTRPAPADGPGRVILPRGTAAICAVVVPVAPDGATAPCPTPEPLGDKVLFALLPLLGLAVSGIAYETAGRDAKARTPDDEAFRDNRAKWWAAAIIAALFLWSGTNLIWKKDVLWLALLGPAWVLGAESLRIIAYVALRRGGIYSDLDREWLARISGSKIRTVLAVTCLAGATVLLPDLLIDRLKSTESWITFAAGLLSGPLAAIGGTSALTKFLPGSKPAKDDSGWLAKLPLNFIIATVAVAFAVLLLMLLGRFAAVIATLPLPGPCPVSPGVSRVLLPPMVFAALAFSPWLWACARGAEPLALTTTVMIPRLTLAALFTATFFVYQGCNIDVLHRATIVLAGDRTGVEAAGCIAVLAYALAAFATTCAIGIATLVNLNHFSMHAVYRNRLMRAFLGSARSGRPVTDRKPDRFTDFDPKDNFRMADTFPLTGFKDGHDEERGHIRHPRKLFPVINVTLNRTSGKDTARAERKGAPFTITPLHCGSPVLRSDKSRREATSNPALPWPDGAYVETSKYAGGEDRDRGADDQRNGISLGTAMTISGAAVSPNMGYNSSPFTAFLMTLFNVRLGAWLPNPGRNRGAPDKDTADIMQRSGPKNAIPTMLQELTGQSDDQGDYIYLSDGGHFDNLGLYEMLRRRAKHILVVDADADPDYAGFDLGHALEIARVDLGVQVEFITPMEIGNPKLSRHGAVAKISYPGLNNNDPANEGSLIYLKPWLPAGLPVDLQAYAKSKPTFPHTSTADQFFTESDFEAYRHLGECLANDIFGKISLPPGDTALTLSNLFRQAKENARPGE